MDPNKLKGAEISISVFGTHKINSVIAPRHHLPPSSHGLPYTVFFAVPSPCWQKQRGQCGGTGGRVGVQQPNERGQGLLAMPPPGGFAMHLRTPAMTAA